MPLNASGNYATKHSSHLDNFFDTDKIDKAVSRGLKKQLGWFGGYCRRAAMNSLKDSPGTSPPGTPPNVHTVYLKKHVGKKRVKLKVFKARMLFKDSILYSYDAATESVIIGPFLFSGGDRSNPVPGLLEHGGRSSRRIKIRRGGVWTKPTRYPARPYMRPAFERSMIAFRNRLKGFVTRG